MVQSGIALITGAAVRIGRTLALDLATHGWKVGLHCHGSTAQAQELAEQIRREGRVAAVLPGNLTDPAAPAHLLRACVSALGAPTLLVNNAAMFRDDDLANLDPTQWNAQFAVNLRAPVFLAKAFAAELPAATAGNIVNIIDQRVWKPTPRYFSYTASKLALWDATRTLAQALAPRIRVNAIGPGPVIKNAHQTDEEFQAQCEATILGRGTSPQEIADAIRFILNAPAMTGQMIALDGGQHLAWQTPDVEGYSASRKS